MTEPKKIFRSGFQETSSYDDISVSRHFKYTMNRVSKRIKIRKVLKIFLCILALLVFSLLFMVFGLFLYPSTVPECKRDVFPQPYESEHNINNNSISLIGRILSRIGICKEKYDDSVAEKIQLNVSKTVSHFQEVSSPILNKDDCKCDNSGPKLDAFGNVIRTKNETTNTEPNTIDRCICNESHETDKFNSNETESKSKENDENFLSVEETVPLEALHINDTNFANESHYLKSNTCDCEGVECVCPEVLILDNFNGHGNKMNLINTTLTNDTNDFNFDESGSVNETEYTDDKKCVCPRVQNYIDVMLNDTELKNQTYGNGVFRGECNCTKLHENDEINSNKSISKPQESKFSLLKSEKCECPETFKLLSKDSKMQFGVKNVDGECICSENQGSSYITGGKITNESQESDKEILNTKESFPTNISNLNKTATDNETLDNFDLHVSEPENHKSAFESTENLKSQDCVCSQYPLRMFNGSKIKTSKPGFKNIDGECVCSVDFSGIHNNESETLNSHGMTRSYETETLIGDKTPHSYETEPLIGDKTPQSYETETYIGDKMPQSYEIETLIGDKMPQSYERETVIGDKIPQSYETETYIGDKMPLSYETETYFGDKMPLSYETETYFGDKMPYSYETETTFNGEVADSSETEIINKSKITYGGENVKEKESNYHAAEETVTETVITIDDNN